MPSRLRRALSRIMGVNVNEDVLVEDHVQLKGCVFLGRNSFGYRTYANSTAFRNARVGRFCSIGRRCSIGAAKHRVDLISTHPVCGSTSEESRETLIENDVWIGDNSVIMAGLTIGNGAVIGAGSVVTRNVDPYSIVVGVPARVLRTRFPPELVSDLVATCWWNYGDSTFEASDTITAEQVISRVRAGARIMLPAHHRPFVHYQ